MLTNKFILFSEIENKNFHYKFSNTQWLNNNETASQANNKTSSTLTMKIKKHTLNSLINKHRILIKRSCKVTTMI